MVGDLADRDLDVSEKLLNAEGAEETQSTQREHGMARA
jgi:hypothetical protein